MQKISTKDISVSASGIDGTTAAETKDAGSFKKILKKCSTKKTASAIQQTMKEQQLDKKQKALLEEGTDGRAPKNSSDNKQVDADAKATVAVSAKKDEDEGEKNKSVVGEQTLLTATMQETLPVQPVLSAGTGEKVGQSAASTDSKSDKQDKCTITAATNEKAIQVSSTQTEIADETQPETAGIQDDAKSSAENQPMAQVAGTADGKKNPEAAAGTKVTGTSDNEKQKLRVGSDGQNAEKPKAAGKITANEVLKAVKTDEVTAETGQKTQENIPNETKADATTPQNEQKEPANIPVDEINGAEKNLNAKNYKNLSTENLDNTSTKALKFGVSDNTQNPAIELQNEGANAAEKNSVKYDDELAADITQNSGGVSDNTVEKTSTKGPTVVKQIVVGQLTAVETQNPLVVDLRPSGQTSASVTTSTAAENGNLLSAEQTSEIARPIVQDLKTMTNGANKSLTLQLLPENLGKVRVSLSVTEQQVRLEFKVQSEHTKQLLESISTKLEQVLKNQDTGNGTVGAKENTTQVNNFDSLQLDLLNQQSSQRQFEQRTFKRHAKGSLYQEKLEAQKIKKETKEEKSKSTISILA
ncbi:hypothetical protein FC19_GL000392 [Liquorilactobacillus aquaticus DSM 21051]|uniref:Flagellar hook-length control protein-like C-terminal domain-containing protein n=2 Tax=Liquorilactobacillus aquaticus TaxID=392566 RepID=A0A0R2D029_9LACO|nr:flagellar hook-length control protein FliK [Liquorilactobacillus aquaticus]AJA33766.1 flagellar hook-length control protein FliK [Liquorilactobacillus aquaticus]KRM96866.1 hypothetical protein FC19_GL000392 [Liquorilactobacillus aquaticus DSM 21051]